MEWLKRELGRILVTALIDLAVIAGVTWLFGFVAEPGEVRTIMVGLIVVAVVVVSGIYLVRREAQSSFSTTTSEPQPTGMTNLPVATEAELQQSYLRGRRFRLVDVPRTGSVISKRTWENCLIEGPAVVWMTGSMLTDTTIGVPPHATDLEPALLERADLGWVVGVVGVDGCVIRSCVLADIAFLGNKDQLDHMRENVNPPS